MNKEIDESSVASDQVCIKVKVCDGDTGISKDIAHNSSDVRSLFNKIFAGKNKEGQNVK